MSIMFQNRGFLPLGKDVLIPADSFRLFADHSCDTAVFTELHKEELIRNGESMLDRPYRMLDATLYMRYARTGNRSDFEDPYNERRTMVMNFALAELAERKGRFTDRLIDGIWHILEESTWILPAHNFDQDLYPGTPLPGRFFTAEEDDDVRHIDLFSAATAGILALVYYLCRDILDREAPVIAKRILTQLKLRILHPFFTYNHDSWMGASGNRLNNWTPWICSNILTVLALCETDDELRRIGAEKCMTILDRYFGPCPDDGGCDEGANYWNIAAGSCFDCAEILYDMSGGTINLFGDPLLRNMCEYIMNFSIGPRTFINFADAPSRMVPDAYLIHRMGRRLDSPRLCAFASYAAQNLPLPAANDCTVFRGCRIVRNAAENVVFSADYVQPHTIFYPSLQVSITREPDGMLLAFKGGTNGESHNHNDVGEFVLFDRESPVFIDAGVETYSRDTFSDRRYTLWPMRGNYHNIAEIAGIEQQAGIVYHADIVSEDQETGVMTLELKNAYPADAHIETYQRTASLLNNTVTVTEELRLSEPSALTFHYLVTDPPAIDGQVILLRSGHKAIFDSRFTAEVEEIPLNGGKISQEWERNSLYRISLKAKEPLTSLSCTMTITRA